MEIQTFQIRFNQIVFAADDTEVIKNCQTPYKNHPNGCPNYHCNWSCPPYAPKVQETRNSLKTFTFFWILIMEIPIPKININFIKKWKTKHDFSRITRNLNNFLEYFQIQHSDWAVYFCSECRLCLEKKYSRCNCPSEPCRFPDKIRISPEAAGIDVFATLKNIDLEMEELPKTNLRRMAMCATDKKVDFTDEIKEYQQYLAILNKFFNPIF